MNKVITINFDFLEDIYYFLASYKITDDQRGYYSTLMDSNLETLLYGDHLIKEQNGYLQIEIVENSEHESLKLKITEALSEFLKGTHTKMENLVIT